MTARQFCDTLKLWFSFSLEDAQDQQAKVASRTNEFEFWLCRLASRHRDANQKTWFSCLRKAVACNNTARLNDDSETHHLVRLAFQFYENSKSER